MNYVTRKANARTLNTTPTKTDQSGALQTDINHIVKQYQVTGMVPGHGRTPMYGDFTNLPNTLRDALAMAGSYNDLRKQLPEQLQGYTLEQLVALTPEQLTNILTPPQPVVDDKDKK